jgi:hypothetical protein
VMSWTVRVPVRSSSRTTNILFLVVGEISMAFSCGVGREEARGEVADGKLGGGKKFWGSAVTLV